MKPSEFFTVEMAIAMGITFVGALVAFGVVYYLACDCGKLSKQRRSAPSRN